MIDAEVESKMLVNGEAELSIGPFVMTGQNAELTNSIRVTSPYFGEEWRLGMGYDPRKSSPKQVGSVFSAMDWKFFLIIWGLLGLMSSLLLMFNTCGLIFQKRSDSNMGQKLFRWRHKFIHLYGSLFCQRAIINTFSSATNMSLSIWLLSLIALREDIRCNLIASLTISAPDLIESLDEIVQQNITTYFADFPEFISQLRIDHRIGTRFIDQIDRHQSALDAPEFMSRKILKRLLFNEEAILLPQIPFTGAIARLYTFFKSKCQVRILKDPGPLPTIYPSMATSAMTVPNAMHRKLNERIMRYVETGIFHQDFESFLTCAEQCIIDPYRIMDDYILLRLEEMISVIQAWAIGLALASGILATFRIFHHLYENHP